MVCGGGYVKYSNKLLSLKDISAGYNTDNVINNITFDISDENGLIALIGPNGSGKTTIIRTITGQIPVSSGQIFLNGSVITNKPTHDRAGISCIFQRALDGMCSSLNIEENLSIMLMDSKPSILKSLISKLKKDLILSEAKDIVKQFDSKKGILDSLEKVLNREPIEFSGGEIQQLSLFSLLLQKPPAILVLADEPTLNLDTDNRRNCLNMLVALSKITTVLVATHDKELINISSKKIKIEKGEILK